MRDENHASRHGCGYKGRVSEPLHDNRLRPSHLAVAIVALASSAVLFVTMGAMAQVLSLAWGLWFSEAFVFLAVPVLTLQLSGRSVRRSTGLDQPAAKGLAAGALIGLANYAAFAVPLMWLAEQVFPADVVARYSSARLFDRQNGIELAFLIAGVSLAAPFCEEMLYRGVVQAGFAEKLEAPRAIVVTALIFSFMHFDPVGFLARFELGLVFGLLAWRGGSLWPAIGAHAANNFTSVVVFFALGGTDLELPAWGIALLFVVGLAALAGAVTLLRRTNGWVAPKPAADEVAPFASFFRALAPWFGAAALALGALGVLDRRGVELNLIDLLHPAKRPNAAASDGERAAWRELDELRASARRGEAGLDEYRSMRRLAAEKPEPQPKNE